MSILMEKFPKGEVEKLRAKPVTTTSAHLRVYCSYQALQVGMPLH